MNEEELIALALLVKRYEQLSGHVLAVAKQVGPAGKDGTAPEHQWDGTKVRFKKPNGQWGKWVDLIGPKGKQGNKGERGREGDKGSAGRDGEDGDKGDEGPVGPAPDHQWKGTQLRFKKPDGTWGKWTDLKGADGKKVGGTTFIGGGSSGGTGPVEYNGYFPMGW